MATILMEDSFKTCFSFTYLEIVFLSIVFVAAWAEGSLLRAKKVTAAMISITTTVTIIARNTVIRQKWNFRTAYIPRRRGGGCKINK